MNKAKKIKKSFFGIVFTIAISFVTPYQSAYANNAPFVENDIQTPTLNEALANVQNPEDLTEVLNNPALSGVLNQTPTLPSIATITPQQYLNNPAALLNLAGTGGQAALAQNVLGLVQSGVDPTNIIQTLQSNGIPIPANLSPTLSALASGNINPTTAINILSSTFSGQIPSQLTSALAVVPGLGNINSAAGIAGIINNPAFANVLGNLPVAEQAQALTATLAAATGFNIQNIANISSPQAIQQLNNAITQSFPELAGVLESLPGGLGGALSGTFANIAGGTLGGLTSGLGGDILGGLLSGEGINPNAIGSALVSGLVSQLDCLCATCSPRIIKHYEEVWDKILEEFTAYETWLVTTYFIENILPAMQLFAMQMTNTAMSVVEGIGMMLDAKHQLETQRLFQQLTAQAHKDYQPSEGMCTFGTNVRSLAGSERRSNLVQTTFAQRMIQRQALNGDVLSVDGNVSDKNSRIQNFIATYCDPADNGNELNTLCLNTASVPARRNIDVDFTRNIESRLTLDVDFTSGSLNPPSVDEQDVFALSANLFANDTASRVQPTKLGTGDQRVHVKAAELYMDLRAIFAKRSVAQNSLAALTSMRAAGDSLSAPYTKAIMRDLGVADDGEIDIILGVNPSYFAQMEVLTKKLYQNPKFYTELYDKPVNVERKGAALQAIGLMQDRDLYNSLLRSEASLSVLLEVMLEKERERVGNARGRLGGGG